MSEPTKIILRTGESVVVAWPDGETQVVVPRGVPVFTPTTVSVPGGERVIGPEPGEYILNEPTGPVHDPLKADRILAWLGELKDLLGRNKEIPQRGAARSEWTDCPCANPAWPNEADPDCPRCSGSGLMS